MTDQNNAAQAAEQDPLSDQFVNAVIRQHGYQSPEAVCARLYQWIGLNGSENGVTLLMYEAHKALVKLRAPVAGEATARRQALLEAIHRYGNARAMAEHNIAYRDEVRNTADALIALFDAAPQASEAVRQQRAEDVAYIARLRAALILARDSHGVCLLTDPPQDAWKARLVNDVISAALSAQPGAQRTGGSDAE